MRRGDTIEVIVDTTAIGGRGVARVGGLVLFVRGGVPGDRVRVRITAAKKSFAEAEILDVLHPSQLRTTPRCRHFGTCGGCTWQHLNYHAQLEFKRQHVVDALERIGGFLGPAVQPVLGAQDPYFYRNKMEFSFGKRWRTTEEIDLEVEAGEAVPDSARFALGLHIPGRYDRVLDLTECWLQSETSAHIVNSVRDFCRERDVPVYSADTHEGYLRNLVIRESRRTGEIMVNVVTREDRGDVMALLTSHLLAEFPFLTTVVNNITESKSQVAIGEHEKVHYGPGTITEIIGERTYRISANSFFQTNTVQAERLYDTVARLARLRRGDIVYDLYSGTGTIALHVSDDVQRVIGIETVEQAVEDAHKNAQFNGVTNCVFLRGDLKETLVGSPERKTPLAKPDVILVDPPRAGMHEKVAREICLLNPRTIVYISCNPATQARDLSIICESGKYTLDEIQPVDMFPHTHHIENIVAITNSHL